MFAVLSAPALDLLRLPGPHGPLVRCSGRVEADGVESLRRLLCSLGEMGHPTITLNLAACDYVDVDGIVVVLEQAAALNRKGQRLVVVSGAGPVRRLLNAVEIDRVIPVFPTEEAADSALRGCAAAEPYGKDWPAARAESVVRWREILRALDSAPPAEIERLLTSMHGLCHRSEEASVASGCGSRTRCHSCPLFHRLGGRPQDIGCESLLQPIIQSLLDRDRLRASCQVRQVIRLLEQMELPPA